MSDDAQQRVVEAARRGDRRAVQELVEATMPALHDAAAGLMGEVLRQRHRTSDFVQSTLVEAISCFGDFRGSTQAEFASWTLRILENNIRDRRRFLSTMRRAAAREQQDYDLEGLVGLSGTPSQAAIDREQLVRVGQAMQRLSEEHRRILHLIGVRGLSHRDAAEALNRSEGACRVLLARARARLLLEMNRGEP